MADAANVLSRIKPAEQSFAPSLFGRVAVADYRRAVAKTVRAIKSELHLSNERLAELLGCSEGTIANAENEHGNLDAVTMLNLGALFGGEGRLKHVLALINGSPDRPPTIAERLERIEREAAAIRKELA